MLDPTVFAEIVATAPSWAPHCPQRNECSLRKARLRLNGNRRIGSYIVCVQLLHL